MERGQKMTASIDQVIQYAHDVDSNNILQPSPNSYAKRSPNSRQKGFVTMSDSETVYGNKESPINVYGSSTSTLGQNERERSELNSRSMSSRGQGRNGFTDFFSSEVFQIVLHNPTTAHRFLKFCQSRACSENIEFLQKVRKSLFA